MIQLVGTFVLATLVQVEVGVDQGVDAGFVNPDVLVKTVVPLDAGVDHADNWVLFDEGGLHVGLPLEGIRFAAPAESTRVADAVAAAKLGLDRWIRIQVQPDADGPALLAAIRNLPIVEHAEFDAVGGLAGTPDEPNDPNFDEQWGMYNSGQSIDGVAGVPGADVRALEAWELTTGDQEVVVATLDSGSFEHLDMLNRIIQGRNIPQETDNTVDVCVSHGTHVAGTIAALGDNSLGVAGMCWNARIMPIVVVDPCGGYESWVADGVYWAVDNGADMINMSLQYYTGTTYLHDAIMYGSALDIPMIAATGNYDSTIAYPARWQETIAVGAITNMDLRWSGSNEGPEIDLVAPGHDIISTQLVSSYGMKSGTSHAAPHVTGTVALLLSIDGSLTNGEIRDILNGTARDISLAGFDEGTGWGCLDARAALEVVLPPEPDADLNGDGTVNGFDLTYLFASWGPCEDCLADLTDDGLVDGFDLVILLSQWTL